MIGSTDEFRTARPTMGAPVPAERWSHAASMRMAGSHEWHDLRRSAGALQSAFASGENDMVIRRLFEQLEAKIELRCRREMEADAVGTAPGQPHRRHELERFRREARIAREAFFDKPDGRKEALAALYDLVNAWLSKRIQLVRPAVQRQSEQVRRHPES